MASVFFYAALLWYGVTVGGLAIGIYGALYFARLFDITRRQFSVALLGGIVLSTLTNAFYYFTSTHMVKYLDDEIFTYTVLTISSITIVCLVYFLIIGRRNLHSKYNIDIKGLWPWEINRKKKMHK